MICAKFLKKNNFFMGFSISGHAGCGEDGNDIVCASVSSAVQLTANNITECFEIEAEVNVEDNKIYLEVNDTEDIFVIEDADRLIGGLILHLELLSQDFVNTIDLKITEV